ncbi:type VII secretion protein EccB [Kitasatospora viridis]|uniref:Type VII secretion protein EccB n=1 Tax=Kitasatospora viridis TaxID=281105 RepID=A0A561UD15_9ACTN|nr:type VII secretion protein EccB [Kitasatospora viridis]TWF97235.1 type VII secretion protein EccB [Kitasatospora viridis]
MQSRRDQVQAHLFVLSRLASGMLRSEPDAPDTPTGRTTRGAVGGLALGVLIALVVTVIGVFKPGVSTGWQKPGALVVVEETGARYLYLGGALHPVLNQTSAKLLAGDQLTVQQVSERSLDGTQRGGPVGLLGAPDGLPPAAALGGGQAWLVCATPGGKLALAIGPQGEGTGLTPGQALLVAAPDGSHDLLWQGRRLRIDRAGGVEQALGYAAAVPFPVSAAYLDTLPAGPDLTAPAVTGRGTAGPQLAGRPSRVGQLFEAPGGGRYVLTTAGLAPLTTLQFELLRGDPRTQQDAYGGAAPTPAAIGPEDLAAHTAPAPDGAGLPAEPPALLAPGTGQGVCTDLHPTADPGATRTSVTLLDQAGLAGAAPAAQPGVRASCTPADLVAVRPGGGALVRAALAGGSAGDAEFLVADNGVAYPVPGAAAAKQLGYAAVSPTTVPAALLALLPVGPSLDPAALAGGGVPAPAAATPC